MSMAFIECPDDVNDTNTWGVDDESPTPPSFLRFFISPGGRSVSTGYFSIGLTKGVDWDEDDEE